MPDEDYRWRTVVQQFYWLLLEFLQDYFWYWQKPMTMWSWAPDIDAYSLLINFLVLIEDKVI